MTRDTTARLSTLGGPIERSLAAHIGLRHLRAFVTVAEEAQITRASQRLKYSQPTLSRQLAELQTALGGVKLVRNDGHRTVLTPAGQAYLRHARAALAELDRGAESIKDIGQGSRQPLALGLADIVDRELVLELIQAARAALPEATLTVIGASSAKLETALTQGRLDFALLGPASAPEELRLTPVGIEPLYAIACAEHPIVEGASVSLFELKHETLILPPPRWAPAAHAKVLSVLTDAGATPDRVHHALSASNALVLAQATQGVALLPGSAVRDRLSRELVALPLDPSHTVTIALAWQRDAKPPLNPETLVERLKTTATGLGTTAARGAHGNKNIA